MQLNISSFKNCSTYAVIALITVTSSWAVARSDSASYKKEIWNYREATTDEKNYYGLSATAESMKGKILTLKDQVSIEDGYYTFNGFPRALGNCEFYFFPAQKSNNRLYYLPQGTKLKVLSATPAIGFEYFFDQYEHFSHPKQVNISKLGDARITLLEIKIVVQDLSDSNKKKYVVACEAPKMSSKNIDTRNKKTRGALEKYFDFN